MLKVHHSDMFHFVNYQEDRRFRRQYQLFEWIHLLLRPHHVLDLVWPQCNVLLVSGQSFTLLSSDLTNARIPVDWLQGCWNYPTMCWTVDTCSNFTMEAKFYPPTYFSTETWYVLIKLNGFTHLCDQQISKTSQRQLNYFLKMSNLI